MQGQDLDGAGTEGIAALGRHEHVAVAHDAHFEREALRAGGGVLVGVEDGVPPGSLDVAPVGLGRVVSTGGDLVARES